MFGLVVLVCWTLPWTWYTKIDPSLPRVWITEVTNAPGWQFSTQPLDKSAESILAADALLAGQFVGGDGKTVKLFIAKRFEDNPNAIGLFVHTPDRCWTESGWQIEATDPDFIVTEAAEVQIGVERRLFAHPSGTRELVYFFGLLGGQALPYRLDHNLGVGRRTETSGRGQHGTGLRASDRVLWRRVWDAFVSRRLLSGPKEFVRLSTTVSGPDLRPAEQILQRALHELLASHPMDAEHPSASLDLPTPTRPTRR